MGVELLKLVKNIIAPKSDDSTSSATQNAMKTAPTTSAEQSASVFTEENYNNNSSTTVILSSDYRDYERESWTDNYTLEKDDSANMETIMNKTFGAKSVDNMTEGEINTVMQSIVDNNRWMMEDINSTYLKTQVTQDIIDTLYPDGVPDGVDENTIVNYVEDIVNNNEKYTSNTQELTEEEQQLKEIAQKVQNDKYDKFDENVRTSQIPPEIIAATEFCAPEDIEDSVEIFVPDLNTLKANGTNIDEQLSNTVVFEAGNKSLTFDDISEMDEQQAKQYIQNVIAENYGLGKIAEDGTFKYGSYNGNGEFIESEVQDNGNGNADLTDSYAGIAILTAIAKEEGNNDMMSGIDEDPSAIIDKLYQSIKDGNNVYCPDTEMNVLYDSTKNELEKGSEKLLLAREGNSGTITYIHAKEDSIIADSEGNLTGENILSAYDFNGKTLAQIGANPKTGDAELVLSAMGQIMSNNPSMQQTFEDGFTSSDLEDTPENRVTYFLEQDFSGLASQNGGEIVLENIQYIVGSNKPAPTPKVEDTPTSVTEPPVTEPPVTEPPVTEPPVTEPPVTEPPVTEPPVTEPPVTEPPVTEPPVTEPPVTEPPVTEPPVTDPPPTEEPIVCPDPPDVTPSDTPLPSDTSDLKDPSETPSEAPTEAPTEDPDIPQTTTCPPIGTEDGSLDGDNDTNNNQGNFNDEVVIPQEPTSPPQTDDDTPPQETTCPTVGTETGSSSGTNSTDNNQGNFGNVQGGGEQQSQPQGGGEQQSQPQGGGEQQSQPQGGGEQQSQPQGGGEQQSQPQGGGEQQNHTQNDCGPMPDVEQKEENL